MQQIGAQRAIEGRWRASGRVARVEDGASVRRGEEGEGMVNGLNRQALMNVDHLHRWFCHIFGQMARRLVRHAGPIKPCTRYCPDPRPFPLKN